MALDMRTMMVLYGLANAVTAAAVGLVWYQNRRHFSGLSLWLVNFLLQTGTIVLFVLRGYIPDLLSMTVANTMAMGGIIALYIGLERFTGKKSSQTHNYALLAVFCAVSFYFTAVRPDLMARNINVTVMTLVLTGQIAWLLLYRVGPDLRPLTAITGAVIAVYAAVTLARLVLSAIFPTTSGDFFRSGTVDTVVMMLYGMLSVMLGFSLTLMVNRRLLDEVTARARDVETEMGKRVEFTRALVHEMKTPLTAMIASSELLSEELTREVDRSLAQNILRGARGLASRVNELFDLARGEIGLLKLELSATDVSRLVTETVGEMAPLAASRKQTLSTEMPSEEIPPAMLDPQRIKQVLINLIGNAVKFTPAGGRIAVRARTEADNIIFEVEDNGPGIPASEQATLFSSYRVKGADHASGLGLGLPLSRMLVELHGGRIWVKSEQGRGSTFSFSLPLRREA